MGHSKPRVLPRAPILPGARGRARAAAASEGAEPANGCAARGANVSGPPSCSIRSGGKLRFWFFFPHPFPCLGCWSWSHTVWDMLCFSCEENYNVKRKGDRQDRAFRTGSGRWLRRLFCSPWPAVASQLLGLCSCLWDLARPAAEAAGAGASP